MCEGSEEVAAYFAGYVGKQLNSEFKCKDCMIMRASEINIAAEPSLEYSQLLSRGGLSIPSTEIKHYVCNGFAILELVEHILLNKFSYIPVRKAARFVLLYFHSSIAFSCPDAIFNFVPKES